MLKTVSSKGLKGLEFNQDLYPKTLFVGPNGSGKSARAMAAILTILGYMPGTKKINKNILDSYSSGNKLMVGVRINGTLLNRQWQSTKSGSVKEYFFVDTKKASRDNFVAALTAAGNPKIFDLHEFNGLSDQKKIDFIFSLFPPAGDIDQLESDIDNLKEKLNSKRAKIRESENFVSKLLSDRADLNLPSGTLAETSGKVKKLENELTAAQDELKKVEVEIAQAEEKRKAEAKAEQDRKDREKAEAEAKAEQDEKEARMKKSIEDSQTRIKQLEQEAKAKEAKEQEPPPVHQFPDISGGNGDEMLKAYRHEAGRSIKIIIDAIKSVNCPVCVNGAGVMIARKELNRWTKE